MADMRKCGIIGTGNVGAASAYTLAVSGLFSEVLLLDADMHRAEGEAADIAHGFGGPAGYTQAAMATLRTADWLFSRPGRTSDPARLERLCSGETAPSCKAFWNS